MFFIGFQSLAMSSSLMFQFGIRFMLTEKFYRFVRQYMYIYKCTVLYHIYSTYINVIGCSDVQVYWKLTPHRSRESPACQGNVIHSKMAMDTCSQEIRR